MVEAKKQLQREVNVEEGLEGDLPQRGKGRETGRARQPLTDEERAERHKFIDDCMKEGKSQEQCVQEWEQQHGQ